MYQKRMSREVTITAAQLAEESDQTLQLMALGMLYVSGFSIVVEAGPPTPLWLLLDSAVVAAAYLQHRSDQLPGSMAMSCSYKAYGDMQSCQRLPLSQLLVCR